MSAILIDWVNDGNIFPVAQTLIFPGTDSVYDSLFVHVCVRARVCVCAAMNGKLKTLRSTSPPATEILQRQLHAPFKKNKTSTSHPPSPTAHGRWRKNVYERFASFQVNCFFDKLKRKAFLPSQGDRLATSASFGSSYLSRFHLKSVGSESSLGRFHNCVDFRRR